MKLTPCKNCGSPADRIDYTAATEYFGIMEQTAYIACSQKNLAHCPVEVSITMETSTPHGLGDCAKREKILMNAWNLSNSN